MEDPTGSDWKKLFQEMLAEQDVEKLRKKMTLAEDAIFRRSQALAKNPDSEVERQEIEVACKQLLKIQTEKLGYPIGGSVISGCTEGVGKIQK